MGNSLAAAASALSGAAAHWLAATVHKHAAMLASTSERCMVTPGDLLGGRYAVERAIGSGGMATVFQVTDLAVGARCAAKVMHVDDLSAVTIERFRNEIATLRRLDHPGIMRLLDAGEAEGAPYYVMPYVEGETLRARLEREGRLSIPEALRIAQAIASALDSAHRIGVVHRDLKPENILLSGSRIIVADFGIALVESAAGATRMTLAGASIGTPQYMSPEQAAGDEVVDCRSDVYSLAVLLYEMLTGIPPHSGASVRAILARILTLEPRPVTELRDVPEFIAAALTRAMAKTPSDRFASARELAAAIEV